MDWQSKYLNKIVCGDSLELLKELPDNSIDLVLTDPPYGIDYQSAWRTDKSQWKDKIANDIKPFIEWIKPIYTKLKSGGRVICFERWDVEEVFKNELKVSGFIIKSQIIWDKIIHGMGDLKGEFAPQHENILYATKDRYEFNGKRPTTVLRYQRVQPDKLLHPNEKPADLLGYLIDILSAENDIILDPFCGSGTTCVAAKSLGRRYIGIDISEKYCGISRKRLANTQMGFDI